MRKYLEKCQVCDEPVVPNGNNCNVCFSILIFEEFFLDVAGREAYKSEHQGRRKKWRELKARLRDLIHESGTGWSRSDNWKSIWDVVREMAESIGLEEGRAIELAQTLEERQALENSSTVAVIVPDKLPADCVENTDRKKISDWVAGLPSPDYNVIEWAAFLRSGIVEFHSNNGQPSAEGLAAIRDEEIERQFTWFNTVSIDPAGNYRNRQKLFTRRFIETLEPGTEITMIRIPAGNFEMGSSEWEHMSPCRRIEVPSFYLGETTITQAQWQAVRQLPAVNTEMEDTTSYFTGHGHPVDSVSWSEAVEFCQRLSIKTGRKYRLPTEAEWEYAARAGSATPFAFGEIITPELANYGKLAGTDSGRPRISPVEGAHANAFGLYDMHGNLWEWCSDTWHKDYTNAPENAAVWMNGGSSGYRPLRGGAWCNYAELCTASERIAEAENDDGKLNYIGFRLALDL